MTISETYLTILKVTKTNVIDSSIFNLGKRPSMKCPAIIGTIVLYTNVPSLRNTMNCADLTYTLHHQSQLIKKLMCGWNDEKLLVHKKELDNTILYW